MGVVAKGDPFLITTLQRVPKGTNGAVSISGLIASFLGGLVIGVAYYVGIFFAATSSDLAVAPNQLVVILVGAIGGLLGSLLDSLIGATLQFSGQDPKTGKKVKVEEVEAEGEKKKKKKKDKVKEEEAPAEEAAIETSSKKKKKKDKEGGVDTTADSSMDTSVLDTSVGEGGEKKKKKKKKKEADAEYNQSLMMHFNL